MQATIKYVKDSPRPWEGQSGVMHSVEGSFEDGSDFSVNCKPENSAARITELKALVGQPGEFELKPKKEYQGRKQWSIVSWPGKPERKPYAGASDGSLPRAPYQVRYRDTEEGFQREQRSIHRSVALQWAVESLASSQSSGPSPDQTGWVLKTADAYYTWLSQDAPPAAPPSVASGQHVESKHPSLDELKQRFSLQTADQMPTAREKYIDAINECVQTKNSERLKKLPELIVQSCEHNAVSLDEAEELERHLSAAKKALSSSSEYDRWHAERLTEAQERIPKAF